MEKVRVPATVMSKIHSLTIQQKLKLIAELLNESALLYDVVAALRGPDNFDETLKHVFTARIRCLVGLYWVRGRIRREKEIYEGHLRSLFENAWKADPHYLAHVSDALTALHKMGIMESDEYKFLWNLAETLYNLATEKEKEDVDTIIKEFKKKYGKFIVPKEKEVDGE